MAFTNVAAVRYLRTLVRDRLDSLRSGTYEPHDIRVFIKDEPHKISKMREGRYRLIMVMSLEDQMVDRMLMGTWPDAEKFWLIPGKTGWSPVPAGSRYVTSTFPGDVLATDCSAFDWTFPDWVGPLLLMLRLDMVQSLDDDYRTMLTRRWRAVIGPEAVLRLPDGTRFRQKRWGLMKSGWYRTIAENSAAQVLINHLAWLRTYPRQPMPTIWTMGDDVLMHRPPFLDVTEFETALATTGILVKQSSLKREFAGFEFRGSRVNPLYPQKHRFLLHFVNPSIKGQVAMAYLCLYGAAEVSRIPPWLNKLMDHSPWTWRAAQLWADGALTLNSDSRPP
uniref:RNA-directed RNA polymerase n=1 Tax=Cryptotermes secundus sobeli-like virus 2 TaxID=3133511 RepID=A0AAT9JGB8_9VIRU